MFDHTGTYTARRLCAAQRHLGAVLFELVGIVDVEDANWRALAERFTVIEKTVKRWTAEAINAPAEQG